MKMFEIVDSIKSKFEEPAGLLANNNGTIHGFHENLDGTVDISGNVRIGILGRPGGRALPSIIVPAKINFVTGSFEFDGKTNDFANFPKIVGKGATYRITNISTLDGIPDVVGGNFSIIIGSTKCNFDILKVPKRVNGSVMMYVKVPPYEYRRMLLIEGATSLATPDRKVNEIFEKAFRNGPPTSDQFPAIIRQLKDYADKRAGVDWDKTEELAEEVKKRLVAAKFKPARATGKAGIRFTVFHKYFLGGMGTLGGGTEREVADQLQKVKFKVQKALTGLEDRTKILTGFEGYACRKAFLKVSIPGIKK